MPSGSKGSPGPLTQELAALLRGELARRRTNAAQIAKDLPWSADQIRGILAGTKHPDVDQLDAIAKALGLSAVDLLAAADRATADRWADGVGGSEQDGGRVTPITRKTIEDMDVDEIERQRAAATRDASDPQEYPEG